ncbi:phosphoglucomutase (alpha-D-glucose-1,6-bisphosphate-dependent) [Janibacter sp. GS2]|uniref:phosphoglucomutase (alpha-D-glucose-1,6-bisphosphate-dependent) n=1 Tax=Janibacter sp. GS2 TaxID=3442646 RepID=UPI003EBCF6A9
MSSAADRAGSPALPEDLIDVSHVVTAYYAVAPDPEDVDQQVAFGTSGHRGTSLAGSFNEAHILATTQAIVDVRRAQGIDGPLFLGRDTHALSEPAWTSALEVLVGNDVTVLVDSRDGYTPTPAISHAILTANRGKDLTTGGGLADGIVVTPSHNPPGDGGFKYNPPHGGPADSDATSAIADAANAHLRDRLRQVRRTPFARARASATDHDYLAAYVDDLPNVVDLQRIKDAGVRIGADPMGGAAVHYWGEIGERHGLDVTVVNPLVDPTWRFMTLDRDGRIRMDCSSPAAMASLIRNKDRYDIASGNDADADRHGIVTPDGGLMNPNHYLAVALQYLYGGARPDWSSERIGKTLVSSSMIDRVAGDLGKELWEVPVGFKWFVPGLLDGSVGFGGEESAGASFLRFDGSTWTTDKDGIILALLASEILATTGRSPSAHYADLVARHGEPAYARIDAPATRDQKAALKGLTPDAVTADTIAGEPITAKLTTAPGNGAAIGGLKVVTEAAWFAARPSGTEDVYKIYAESFRGPEHLTQVQADAKGVVDAALG